MAKHILDLHRTILFTRPRHPHGAARRCGSGAGSQQCFAAGALALALAPAFWPSDAAAHTCDAPFTTDLVTGTGIDVGEVEVCNDAEFLTVTYETTWPWCVLKTNLHVASDLAGIPKFRLLGTPNFLQFDLHRGGRLRGSGARRHSVGRDRWRGRARRDRHHRRPRRGRRRRPGRHPPALPARRQVRGVGRGPAFPPASARDVLHLRGAGGLALRRRGRNASSSPAALTTASRWPDGGDAICNARAAEAGLPGAYEAWLSIGGTGNSAAERLNQAAVPYKLVDGSTVANDFADLTTCDGSGGRVCSIRSI